MTHSMAGAHALARAHPPTKELFLIIPTHMTNRKLIPAGKRVQRCPL